MHNEHHDIKALLAEIERLKLENAILRKAAGINASCTSSSHQVDVTHDERRALLEKTI